VVIHGESGTGKELIARALHAASKRTGELVAVNCGALPETLVESQLFGYRKGAFSGATQDREGLVAAARGGSLFLDEIGDLAPSSQAAFLRLLQEQEYTPVGATKPVTADVRVIAATHHDLEELVAKGAFRDDLAARLNGFTFTLPPLRERRTDMGLLIGALVRRIAADAAGQVRFSSAAGQRLIEYEWPRNIRELEKCLEAAIALAADGPIQVEHLGAAARSAPPTRTEAAVTTPKLARDADARRAQLAALLTEHHGNISRIARELKTSRTQVQRWVKRFGFDASKYRKGE
jgi:transcriptional regulator with PAS, ATPase and Fis domain